MAGEDRARLLRLLTVVGNEITSAAYVFTFSAKYASLEIDTTMPFRRQALVTLASVALIEDCLGRGLTLLWNCLASNEASANTALKLGMEKRPFQSESQWRPGLGQVTSLSGLWEPDERTFDSQCSAIVW